MNLPKQIKTIIGILVILIIVSIGWWVWDSHFNFGCNNDSDCINTCCGCMTEKEARKNCLILCFFLPPRDCRCINGECKDVLDETANWQTYRNEGYGFEIKYPRDWFITISSDNKVVYFESPAAYKLIQEGKKIRGAYASNLEIRRLTKNEILRDIYKSILDYLEKDPTTHKLGEITVNDHPAYEVSIGGYGVNYGVWILKDNYVYQLSFSLTEQKPLNTIESQMLSTFRFIDNRITTQDIYITVSLKDVINYADVSKNNYVRTRGTIVALEYSDIHGSILLSDDSDNYLLATICHACMQHYKDITPLLREGTQVEITGIASFTRPKTSNLEERLDISQQLPEKIGMVVLDYKDGIKIIQ